MKKPLKTSFLPLFALLLSASAIAQTPALQWAKGIGGNENDSGQQILTDGEGNVYVIGKFKGTVDFDPGPAEFLLSSSQIPALFIQKLSGQGEFLWVRELGAGNIAGNIFPQYCRLDVNGNLLLMGTFSNTFDFDPGPGTFNLSPTQDFGIFTLKLDPQGQFIDARNMTGPFEFSIFGLFADQEENTYAVASFIDTTDVDPGPGVQPCISTGAIDFFLQKRNAGNDFLWATCFSGISVETATDLLTDPEGNIYMTGNFYATMDLDPGPGTFNQAADGFPDAYIVKLSPNGQFIWARVISGPGDATGTDLALDPDGNLLLMGVFRDEVDLDPGPGVFQPEWKGLSDIFIVKLDEDGNFLWAGNIGSPATDIPQALITDDEGSVYLAGSYMGTADFDPGPGVIEKTAVEGRDIFIVKLDQSGAFQWFGAVEGANNMSADPIGLSLDTDQNLYITGSFRTPADFDPSTGAFPLTNKGLSDGFVAKWAQMTTGMAEPTDAGSDVRFFPNPTQHACQFQFADPGKDVTISLYSPTGLLLKRWFYEEVSSGFIILEELAGWYLIRVDRQDGPSVVQKIIKQ